MNEPNPCSDRTDFHYFLYQPVDSVFIDIFTISGRKVAVLQSPPTSLAAGWNKVSWNLIDKSGDALGNGLYIYQMRIGKGNTEVKVKKAQLMVIK